jgi:two-component system, LytTR family, sensor kinase
VWERGLRRASLYVFIWTVVGVFLFSRGLTQRLLRPDPTPWWHYVLSWMMAAYVWALLTPAMLWLGRRFPLERPHRLRRTLLHLALGSLFSVVQLAGEGVGNWAFGLFPPFMATFPHALRNLLPLGFHNGVLTYWVVLSVQWTVLYYRRTAELRAQLASARLSAMKMQLQPHFLFNTLNAIVVLVRQQKGAEAEEMLGHLSDLLRCVLDDVEAQEVPLQRDLECLGLYLAIEQVRFQDRLRVEITAGAEAREAAVPQLGLQPIVENAIRHGLGGRAAAGRVAITAERAGSLLRIRVEDDGPGFPKGGPRPEGIGLSNTRTRLEHLYGPEARLLLENLPGGGAAVTMVLPYRPSLPAAGGDMMEVDAAHRADR